MFSFFYEIRGFFNRLFDENAMTSYTFLLFLPLVRYKV